jgi:alkaline phosphatase D
MVGAVTQDTATIWVYPGPGARFKVKVGETQFAAEQGATSVTVTGLKPETRYTYDVVIEPGAVPMLSGSFSTAPPAGRPCRFRAAAWSCVKPRRSWQDAWAVLLDQAPSLQLLLGDNVYSDSTDPDEILAAHAQIRRLPELAQVMRVIPTYATWDDHDFAGNNDAGDTPGKAGSLEAFKRVWANPAFGTDEIPGVFYSFLWGDVEFFMLDGRYYRSNRKDPNDDRKRMLGDAQFQWLAKGLIESEATFKVIANGSTLNASSVDSWLKYDFARQRLFDLIRDNRIGGVVFLSGDVHYSEVRVHPAEYTVGYDFVEIISSGIANSLRRSFVILEFDTTAADPTLDVRVIDRKANVLQEMRLYRSALQQP